MISRLLALLIVGLAVILLSTPALAADVGDIDRTKVALDTVWVVVAAALVMFMQAGFALVETGFTQAKNACNILMKNLMDFSIGSIAYWAVGFAIMFAAGNWFMGTTGWFLAGADSSPATGDAYVGVYSALNWTAVPLECKYFFQLVFCATAATIVSGAMAGRTKFVAYLTYSVIISAFIYPVVGHWIWGGGWLAKLGMLDFAGSTVVHSVGGWLGLAGAIVLGPRLGKYRMNGGKKKRSRAIPGHSIPLAALGVFILWFGWFGFNPGSTMAAGPHIAHIAATTNIAAAAGAVAAMLIYWLMFGKPDASMTLNGALAGLVAITAGCAFVSLASAVVIGLLAGVLVVLAVLLLDRVLHIDDPVGAVSVHGVCGLWGTLAVGLFAQEKFGPTNGLFFGGGLKQLGLQALGAGAIFIWCMVCGFAVFYTIKALIGLRVSKEDELKGLDITEHGMEAYSGFQIFTTQ